MVAFGSLAVLGSWVSFGDSTRAVMAVSVLLAVAPVLAALVSERIWLGNVDDPSRWGSGTGWCRAWEGHRPVRFFADQKRIIVSPTDAVVFRTLRRS